MKILFIEPYNGGSHKIFLEQFISQLHKKGVECDSVSLAPKKWRWRFLSAHFHLAEIVNDSFSHRPPEVIICSSLMDTASFKALLGPAFHNSSIITFFHENQLAYPIYRNADNIKDQQKLKKYTYPLVHLNQILSSDALLFNSRFNYDSLFHGLDKFIRTMPDARPYKSFENAKKKCFIIGLGIEIAQNSSELLDWEKRPSRILWNHRWEYDKNPQEFVELFTKLIRTHPNLELDLLGDDRKGECSDTFLELNKRFPTHIKTFGGLNDRKRYIKQLGYCRLLPVTSNHDFFGLSIIDAIVNGVIPLLPNRLSYPELIAPSLHEKLLYSSFKELYQKSSLLLNIGLDNKEKEKLLSWLRPYSWSEYSSRLLKILHLIRRTRAQFKPLNHS
ncbi:MAG: tRNA-queuosine alpha-mannosyltransferase domain-containing protein [Bacteriovoracaceae bacterium]